MSVLMPIPVDFILKIVPVIFIAILTLLVACIAWIIVEIHYYRKDARLDYRSKQLQKVFCEDNLTPGSFTLAMCNALSKGWIAKRVFKNNKGEVTETMYVVCGEDTLKYGYIKDEEKVIHILGDYSPTVSDMTFDEWETFEGDDYKIDWKNKSKKSSEQEV